MWTLDRSCFLSLALAVTAPSGSSVLFVLGRMRQEEQIDQGNELCDTIAARLDQPSLDVF